MAAKCVFTAASTFTRLSLLCFYYRLVNNSGKKLFVWAVRGSAIFIATIGIVFTFLSIFQCNPVRNYWIFGSPAHTCLDEGKVTLVAGVVNCVADALCTVLPMPMVMKLQMPYRQRVAVNILFGLGFIVTIAGVVRTYYIYESLIAEYDETWFAYPLWIAAAVEIDLGVICASAPVLRPLLSKIPFSLSTIASKITTNGTGSKMFSAKLPANNKNVSGTTLQNSRSQKSTTDSKRRSGPTLRALDTQDEITQDYELRQWDDLERGLHTHQRGSTDGSQDAILGSDDEGEPEPHPKKLPKNAVKGMDHESRNSISNPRENGAELDRVSTKSSDAVGATYQ